MAQVDLMPAVTFHDTAEAYERAMEWVDSRHDSMLEELSAWSGRSVLEVVQFIGDVVPDGTTFGEQLWAAHVCAKFQANRESV